MPGAAGIAADGDGAAVLRPSAFIEPATVVVAYRSVSADGGDGTRPSVEVFVILNVPP
jgi:hypothetical protein